MREFEKKLLRLKQAIGLTKDQEVARELGMSPAAFSDRKKRNAFPDDKLGALAARCPELHLDVDYILTGESDTQKKLQKRLLAINTASKKASVLNLPGIYETAVQEILFFAEIEDADGVMNAFRTLFQRVAATVPASEHNQDNLDFLKRTKD